MAGLTCPSEPFEYSFSLSPPPALSPSPSGERLRDTNFWKFQLERLLEDMRNEIDLLLAQKNRLRNSLNASQVGNPAQKLTECLSGNPAQKLTECLSGNQAQKLTECLHKPAATNPIQIHSFLLMQLM